MATLKPASAATSTRSWMERLWSSIAERGRPAPGARAKPLSPLDRANLLAEALLSERGEASGAVVARELHSAIASLEPADLLAFHRFLAERFAPDPARLRGAAEAYLADPGPATVARLASAAEAPRQEVLRRMNMSPGGTARLVAMREAVLGQVRDTPALQPLEDDLRHLFGSWFNRGFLEIRRIDWQTPAAVLEKLITYEAVHEIQGWDDLRRRLAPDRRCFGFFHPALPGEPLIFVEVALVRGLAAAVQPLLDGKVVDRAVEDAAAREREQGADTAIFYSISNCQAGLRGISFGNFLIKQVVDELKPELPRLTRFSTLSPVPGFRKWLEPRLEEPELLLADESAAVLAVAPDLPSLLAREWWREPAAEAALRRPLSRLCAVYLNGAGERRGGDPVARFHLGNGARLEQVNWLGNTAPRGIRESFGIMVNYVYDPEQIEANHEAFVRDGVVARSAQVEALTNPPPPTGKPKARRE